MSAVAYATTVAFMFPQNPDREAIAAEVRAAMARRRMNQRTLADAIGLSRAALSPRLAGQQAFDTDQLAKIAEALEVDFLSLFPEEPVSA